MHKALGRLLMKCEASLFRDYLLFFLSVVFVISCQSGSLATSDGSILSNDDVVDPSSSNCSPRCNGLSCGQDGCGHVCECSEGTLCNGAGNCVTDCLESCESTGATCGSVCGEHCGECSPREQCFKGECLCQPKCDGTSCDNGCGGMCDCGPGLECDMNHQCVASEECTQSCEDAGYACGMLCGQKCGICEETQACVLGKCETRRSSLVLSSEKIEKMGNRTQIVLALDFHPLGGQPLPRMADIRLEVQEATNLGVESVSLGDALESADKGLFIDAITGKPWQLLPDGSIQLLVYSTSNVQEIGQGRWLTISVSVDTESVVKLGLTRRGNVFAPMNADSALQGSDYDSPVTVMP